MEDNLEKKFNEKCEKFLPKFIKVNGFEYKIHFYMLLGEGSFRIMYGVFDGSAFDWDKPKLFDLFYEIVKVIPKDKKHSNDIELKGGKIFVQNIDSIINDCLLKLANFDYEKLDEIVTNDTKFYRELTSLLNKYNKENDSNTPDYILINYILGCLRTFNHVISQRDSWHGVEDRVDIVSKCVEIKKQ